MVSTCLLGATSLLLWGRISPKSFSWQQSPEAHPTERHFKAEDYMTFSTFTHLYFQALFLIIFKEILNIIMNIWVDEWQQMSPLLATKWINIFHEIKPPKQIRFISQKRLEFYRHIADRKNLTKCDYSYVSVLCNPNLIFVFNVREKCKKKPCLNRFARPTCCFWRTSCFFNKTK